MQIQLATGGVVRRSRVRHPGLPSVDITALQAAGAVSGLGGERGCVMRLEVSSVES